MVMETVVGGGEEGIDRKRVTVRKGKHWMYEKEKIGRE